jgi:citrate lyase gamma subunit
MRTLLALLLLASVARAADPGWSFVTGNVALVTTAWSTNTRIRFEPIDGWIGTPSGLATSVPWYTNANSSGFFQFKLWANRYRVHVGQSTTAGSVSGRDILTNNVPGDGSTNDWLALQTNSYRATTNHPLTWPRGVAQGSNILTVTSAVGVVTVHGTATSSGGSATNAVATIKTNNVQVGTGVTSLEFTNGSNTTVSATLSGSAVTVTINGPDTNQVVLSASNSVMAVHGPQIAALSNSVASKQHGTATLTNLSGTGALTNITSANSAFTSLLSQSNQPVVKTISGAGAATVTDNGTNIVIETSAASGEANVNGEVFTNATRIGSVYDKQGVTNRLRSLSGGKGITLTNESTNIVFAAEVSNADLTAVVGTTNAYIKSLGGLGTNNGFTTPTNYQIASFWDRSREGDTDHHFYFVVTNGLFELWSDLMVNEPWFSIGDPNEGLNFSQSYHISAGSFLGQKVQATPANTTLTAFEAYAKTGGTAHMLAVYDTNSTTEMFVITSNGTVRTEHIWPLTHVAYDIGSPSLYYRTGYFAAVTVTNMDVRGTLDVETLTATSTPFQWGTATLTNLSENANKSYTNALVAGWGLVLVTNTGVVTVTPTNRAFTIATNATTANLDFSDTANVQEYQVWWHLTTNISLFPTNPVVGRTLKVFFQTNSLSYDVTVTNPAAAAVNWNFNVTTNGAANITKTNTLRARLYLTAETNGTYTAEWGYYRP